MVNKTDLSRVDLNLLVLFEVVLEELHVGRAARRLNLTPSAVSHGLGRLRELMRDPLFLRQPKGVVPTERARQLAVPVAEILERTRQVLDRAERFDPGKSERRFMIGAPDAVTSILLPKLLSEVRRTAPGIDLGIRNLVGQQFEQALSALDQRTLDVALLPIADPPARFLARTIFDVEDFVLVRRAGHPIGRRITLDRYCQAAHVMISVTGDARGPVDERLASLGRQRRVVLTVSNFMHALAIVAASDLIAAVPRRFAAIYGGRFDLVSSEPPFEMPSEPIRAIAPAVAMSDAGLAWLLDMLQKAAK